MSKPTIATVKKFIRENRAHLLVRNIDDFDGMTDCIERCASPTFCPAGPGRHENDLGVAGAWFALHSRDSIRVLNEPELVGYHIFNSCGSFDLAVKNDQHCETP